jgi:hypothetical protein
MRHRRFLFPLRRAPLTAPAEYFDLALTAAAFDHDVTLLLLDDAVWWLKSGLPELVTQSIETILVERESLEASGLSAANSQIIGRDDVRALLASPGITVSE